MTTEEIQEDVRAMQAAGTILERDSIFWQRFIFNGQLNESALLDKGYTEKQIPFIHAEMRRLGWL